MHFVHKLSKVCKEIRRDIQKKKEENREEYFTKIHKLRETENKRKSVFLK